MGSKRVGHARIAALINKNKNKIQIQKPEFLKVTDHLQLDGDQSGKTILWGPAAAGLAADAVVYLPKSPTEGMYFRFVYVGNAADAQDLQIDTRSDDNFFLGGLVQHDPDNGGDDTVVYHPNGSTNSKVNILTPDAGTEIELWCDGTYWFLAGRVISATDAGVTWASQ